MELWMSLALYFYVGIPEWHASPCLSCNLSSTSETLPGLWQGVWQVHLLLVPFSSSTPLEAHGKMGTLCSAAVILPSRTPSLFPLLVY